MKRLALCLWIALSSAAVAQSAADLAREASGALSDAALSLSEADGARNRIAALTKTVRAYERGLAAMREGLRQASLEERALREQLAGRDAELMALLATLQSIERSGGTTQMLHPDGPLPAIRAGMLAGAFVPALNTRAQSLADELTDMRAIVAVQSAGQTQLENGLAGIRAARFALADAVSKRTDLPQSAATDDATMEALINSSETLAAFADNFTTQSPWVNPVDETWDLPVIGRVLRGFNEPDAAGVRRPGWVLATDAGAIVTTPVAATVRFAGALPDFGTVVILEPRAGELLILAGASDLYVQRAQILSEGEPIGLMGGDLAPEQEKLIETEQGGGQPWRETLYIELRQGQDAVDPASRFPAQTE